MVLQARVSPQERDFAAANADAIFSPCRPPGEARAFYRDIRARAARQGRPAGAVKLLPSASFTLGDSKAEAPERYREDVAVARICRLNLWGLSDKHRAAIVVGGHERQREAPAC